MKPITIAKQEFDEALAALINSGLASMPACMMKPSLMNAVQILTQVEADQLQKDKEAWEAEQKGEENES